MLTPGLILASVASLIAAIITWKVSNFFLARREFYVKSRYEILMIKLGWCTTWGFLTFYIVIHIL